MPRSFLCSVCLVAMILGGALAADANAASSHGSGMGTRPIANAPRPFGRPPGYVVNNPHPVIISRLPIGPAKLARCYCTGIYWCGPRRCF
jgi:hypothetical protein